MKFCSILPSHPSEHPGGAEVQTKLILEELASRNHEVIYIAHDSNKNKTIDINGVETHFLPDSSKLSSIELIKDINPDYCYFRVRNDMTLMTLVDAFLDVETIYNISHDGQCLGLFENWPGMKYKSTLHSLYGKCDLSYRRLLLRVPDYLFIQTDKQAKLLRENHGLRGTLTGNGHPIDSKNRTKEDPIIILWLASIKDWKQPELFVKVANECRDLDCEFWIVGQSSDEELTQYISEVSQKSLNIKYFGGCNFSESNEYISKASIFINTSVAEGFPNTFIQAWLRKTVVLSLNVDPNGLLSSKKCGLHANGDLERLVMYTRDLVRNEDSRREIAKKAQEMAMSNYSISSVVDRIENALTDNK